MGDHNVIWGRSNDVACPIASLLPSMSRWYGVGLPLPRILVPLWPAIHPDPIVYYIVLCCMLTDCTCTVCKHMLLIPLGTPHRGAVLPNPPSNLPAPLTPVQDPSGACMRMLPDMSVMQPQAGSRGASPCSAPCGSAHVCSAPLPSHGPGSGIMHAVK